MHFIVKGGDDNSIWARARARARAMHSLPRFSAALKFNIGTGAGGNFLIVTVLIFSL